VSLASRRDSIKSNSGSRKGMRKLDYKIFINLIIRTIIEMAFVFGLEPAWALIITTTGYTAIYKKAASVERKMTAKKNLSMKK
jgi:predicted membrane channel-forming protein YqfA (hemolysin III family)